MANNNRECTVRVAIRKTVQERQYEPYSLELEVQTTCDLDEREDETLRLFNDLQEQCYDILERKGLL